MRARTHTKGNMNLSLRPVQDAALSVARSQNRFANLADYKREARRYAMQNLDVVPSDSEVEHFGNAAFAALYDESGMRSVSFDQ